MIHSFFWGDYMKRIIFDLDGTLLTGSFEFEKKYFTSLYGEDALDMVENMGKYLDEYEKTFPRYHHIWLSKYLSDKSGLNITEDIIDGWIEVMSTVPDVMEENVIQTLENLKKKDCSLAVLTNWYGDTQISRLRKAGILHYFDNVYTGDFALKPHEKAYMWARDDYNIEDCLFVGDNVDKDYIGPRMYGFESILYDKKEKEHKSLVKIKKLNELIKITDNK